MDPLSALSIAASVVQFVDFGKHVLSTSYEIYKSPSGETVKEVELATIEKDLLGMVAHITDAIEASTAQNVYRSEAEASLLQISKECGEIVDRFKKGLGLLKHRKGPIITQAGKKDDSKSGISFLSGGNAVARFWNASKIAGMIEQLERVKSRMTTATLFCLW